MRIKAIIVRMAFIQANPRLLVVRSTVKGSHASGGLRVSFAFQVANLSLFRSNHGKRFDH
jgi:hypothetical protein